MTGRQDLFQQALNQGHSAAWDQQWDQAAAFYRSALDEFPNHPQALNHLGLALFELKDYQKSLDCYLKAARAAPDDPVPIEKIADLFECMDKPAQAVQACLHAAELYLKKREVNKPIEIWKRVISVSQENIQAHSRLALMYERIGEKEKAVAEFLALAGLFQAGGDLDRAMQSANQALQILPKDQRVRQVLALLKERKPIPYPAPNPPQRAHHRRESAPQLAPPGLSPFDEGLNQDPVSATLKKALGVLAGLLFDAAEDEPDENGRASFQNVLKGAFQSKQYDRSRMVHHLSKVVALASQESWGQAVVELQESMGAGLQDPGASFALGYMLTRSGEPDEARRNLRQSMKHPDYMLGARMLLGEIASSQGSVREASIEYLESLKIADALIVGEADGADLRQLYEPLIESFSQTADQSEQARLCENIRKMLLRPDWRSHLSAARGQLPRAAPGNPPIPLAEVLTEARSGQVVESLTKIYDLNLQGKRSSAMEEAFHAVQYAPAYLPLHSMMAEMLLKDNHLQEAVTKFLVVARTYATRGESQRAMEIFQRIIELAPMDLSARSCLIEQLTNRGETEAALRETMALAEVYYNFADLDKARQTYEEALRLAQGSKVDRSWRVQILHKMADIDLQSLDWRQALRIFEQIRTLQPGDEKARTSLIELNFRLGQQSSAVGELNSFIAYLKSQGETEKIISILTTMIEENPERLFIRLRLAEAYRDCNYLEDAIREFDIVGDKLLENGDREGAIQIIRTILSLNPPREQDYLDLLAELKNG
jgi:tetratricopeptide (TPR) repeat protein